MVVVFVWIILLPTDLTLLPQVNTWDTDADLPVIPVMVDTVTETIGITGTLIAIVHHIVDMKGTATATEGTAGIGENAGVRPQPAEVAEDIRLNIGAGEATQEAHRGEEVLVVIGSQTVRVVLASPQQMVQSHAGEVDATPRTTSEIDSTSLSTPQHTSKIHSERKTYNSDALSNLLPFL